MDKKWIDATVEELDVKETQFGPYSPENPDSDKTAVLDENGAVIGWEQEFGEELS